MKLSQILSKIRRSILLIAIGLLLLAQEQLTFAQESVSVIDFGATPNDTLNDRNAIQEAVDFCREKEITNLTIPTGVYVIREEKAIQLMNDIMDGKMGKNPQDVIYTPYYPYTKGLDFAGVKGLNIDATGAVFMVEGWMEPLTLENCQNVTVKGLTIDYKTMPYSEGQVINKTDDYFDVSLTDDSCNPNKMLITRIMFWNLSKNRLMGSSIYFPSKSEVIANGVLRIWASYPQDLIGNVALINHTFHFRPAILINEAEKTTLDQVTIHAQPGMGIVGHRSTDILMKGLRIVPRPGYYQSTNTDATHFTSCKGTIRFEGCMFEGQGDDATNVHGYYQIITRKIGNLSYAIQMEKAWGTHAMVLDFPDPEDTLELVSKNTLEVVDKFVVTRSDTFQNKWETVISLDRALPDDIDNYYLIDVTRLPRLEFVNSYVGSHLARAVLVKTRNVLIENCTMRESTGTAIHIGAEGDWREGAGSRNVIIRNNRIIRCGRGDGTNDNASAIAINVKAPNISVAGIHENVLIENNLIEGEGTECGISIKGTTNATVRNNVFSGCKLPVNVRYSSEIQMYNNYSDKAKLKDRAIQNYK
ncbi:MAG: hypothetical protein ACK5L5_01320 [Bacteroidales bacterium]